MHNALLPSSYAIAGQSDWGDTSIVERLNGDKWEIVGSLGTARLSLAAAVLDGCIYAVGGCNDGERMNLVERLGMSFFFFKPQTNHPSQPRILTCVCVCVLFSDPKLQAWQSVAPLGRPRSDLACAVVRQHALHSCARSPTQPEAHTLRLTSCMQVDGHLYAIGGHNGESN